MGLQMGLHNGVTIYKEWGYKFGFLGGSIDGGKITDLSSSNKNKVR